MDGQLLDLLGAGSVVGALVGYVVSLRQFEVLADAAARRASDGIPLARPATLDRRDFKGESRCDSSQDLPF